MRTTLTTLLLAGLLLAACDGDVWDGTAPQAEGDPPVWLDGEVNHHGTAHAEGDAVDMEADDFYFEPTFVDVGGSKTVTVRLRNEGDAEHTFTIDGQDIDVVLDPGAETDTQVDIGDGAPRFYCRFHESQGMQGAFFRAARQHAATRPADGRGPG